MGNSTKELVNAFNLNNYACDKIDTNFTVEGKEIVGLFASNTNTKEYLRRIGEEIIKRHYSGGSEVAHKYYNLNCFPFVLGANLDKEYLDNGIVKVKLADSTNPAVIHNLKIHFANEFKRAVGSKVVARLQKLGVAEEEAYEWIEKTVGTRAIGMPYLYYIAFNDEYFEWERECDEDPSETFEMLKEMYIQEFNSRLEACGLKSSDFYEYKDDMLYIKDVSDKVVKSVAKYVKKEVALDFRTPGSIESKVENCKNVLSELIYQSTGKSIYGYDYDDFTDEKKIKNGHSFALIPFIKVNGQLKSLSFNDASKINEVFNKEMPNVDDNFISDIRGKTANPQFANCKEPVYAFSNKQIALLLPMIMESPIAYRNGRFEFAVDLRSQQFVFPTPPPTPVPNRHPNSDEKPGPSSKLSQLQPMDSPRQGSGTGKGLLFNHVNLAVAGPSARMSSIVVNPGISGSSSQSLSAAANVPASTNLWTQQPNPWSLPVFYAQSSDISVPRFQPPTQLSSSGPSSWKVAAQNVSAAWSHELCSPQSTSGNKGQTSPKPGIGGLSWNKSGSASWSSSVPSAGFPSWSSSGPSSSKDANKSGSASWSSSVPSAGFSSWKGANESGSAWTSQPIGYWSSQSSNVKEDCKKIYEDFEGAYEKIVSNSSLSKEEQELFEELLYAFNLNNQILECHHTNFIVKNGKIASLIHDNVDVKEYLQKVIDKTKEDYRVNEKEAYDLNEFPFKFLSNCEKNQETTVVANISSGALFNLKKLFIQEHKKKVEIENIDINIVEKAVRSKKKEWVNSQVKEHGVRPDAASKTCFPDRDKLKGIPIITGKDGYFLDRDYSTDEVKSFLEEQKPAKGTGNTTTFKKISKKDDSSSGYSSGFATDTENVSSKAGATTSSGHESMDCENTRRQSQKRKSEDGGSPRKSPRSESGNSSSEEAGDSPRSNLSNSESELCMRFHGANLVRK